jgi:formiminoglutamase
MFLPRFLAEYLESPDPSIFTSRQDPEDKRIGDLLQEAPSNDNCPTVALFGVPHDAGVQRNGGRTGAAAGPDAIRRALYKLTPYIGADQYSEAGLLTNRVTLIDIGNLIVNGKGLHPEELYRRQQDIVAYLVKEDIIPITLGGGHDIAYPDVAGFGRVHKEFGVINLDPHTDVRPLINGTLAHSGSPFRQMLEDENLYIPPGAFVEFGIQRFAVAQAHAEYVIGKDMHIMWYHDIRREGFLPALQTAFRQATGDKRPLFVSFDMDSVRSADAPGVSATAPIGFTADEFCQAAEFFGASPLTKMIDLAELNPTYDVDGRTAKLAAFMLMHFLAGVAERNRP